MDVGGGDLMSKHVYGKVIGGISLVAITIIITRCVILHRGTNEVKAEETSSVDEQVGFNSEELKILNDINDLYYEQSRVSTTLKGNDTISIKIDHSGMDEYLAKSTDESYTTCVMWKLNKDNADVEVTMDGKVIDKYIMVCFGEGYNKIEEIIE